MVAKNFFQEILNKYRKSPYLSAEEVKDWEAMLKKHKIKKNESCRLVDMQYKALNARQRKKQLPRILLDFFTLAEKAEGFEKVMNLTGDKK